MRTTLTMASNKERFSEKDTNSLQDFVTTNDIILFGITGVGKTTVVEHLQRRVPVRYISLGEITRSASRHANDPHITSLMQRGGVWPTDTIISLVRPYVTLATTYILDGVPKHIEEAEWLASHMHERPFDTSAIVLSASKAVIRDRLSSSERTQRPETVQQVEDRISTYEAKHEAIMDILSPTLRRVIEIDTTAITPQEVVNILDQHVNEEEQ